MDLGSLVAAAAAVWIETPRLIVRRLRDEDVEAAAQHEVDPGLMRWIRDATDLATARQKARAMARPWSGADGEWTWLAIVPRGHEGMIGIVALRVVAAANATLELGYRLHGDWHGRGLAFEAAHAVLDWLFEQPSVHRVVALCAADNLASVRLLERLGLRCEGRLRDGVRIGAAFHDQLLYAVVAGDPRP